jgi:hypothetical protein
MCLFLAIAPYLAKWAKKRFGAETLIKTGWNLSEAEYGPGLLSAT